MKKSQLLLASRLTFAAVLAIVPSWALADDFRIESKIFVGKEANPSSETVTLFRGGQIYDFLTKPGETTVFDKPRGRVILLDPVRKVRTEIKSDRLTAFSDELKIWAARQTDPFLKFAADPRFEQSLDAAGELLFNSQFINYRVTTIKANTEAVAQQYLEFADSYARLNALTNPGSVPPFPRLAINAVLFKTQMIPERVQVTMPARQRFGGKTTTMRSEHSVAWRLLESDLQKINEADDELVTFTQVPLEQYLRTSTAAK
ncbi:MAG TPA: hypothetical protein VG056_06055 [Pirellulales bacterium]|jgi:hypothetical protein|nr:hypothetical protein [Pirellulales bacterium]